ncbi:unnamed protein product, partial [Amoebophrya sp. A25]
DAPGDEVVNVDGQEQQSVSSEDKLSDVVMEQESAAEDAEDISVVKCTRKDDWQEWEAQGWESEWQQEQEWQDDDNRERLDSPHRVTRSQKRREARYRAKERFREMMQARKQRAYDRVQERKKFAQEVKQEQANACLVWRKKRDGETVSMPVEKQVEKEQSKTCSEDNKAVE